MQQLDVVQVATQIQTKINILVSARNTLKDRVLKKVNAIDKYREAMHKQVLILKDQGMAATLIPAVAKGECHNEEREMNLAEEMLKVCYTGISAVKAELMGWQTISKNLEEV